MTMRFGKVTSLMKPRATFIAITLSLLLGVSALCWSWSPHPVVKNLDDALTATALGQCQGCTGCCGCPCATPECTCGCQTVNGCKACCNGYFTGPANGTCNNHCQGFYTE